MIFGNIPPIYEVHCKIRDRLSQIVDNWNEEVSVGDIFIEHVSMLWLRYIYFVLSFTFLADLILASSSVKKNI